MSSITTPQSSSQELLLTEKQWEERYRKRTGQIRHTYADEQYVEDVTIDFLYKPHTLIALSTFFFALLFMAYSNGYTEDTIGNWKAGICACLFFLLILGLMVFPSGPFIRPHPLVWRIVFSLNVFYELFLLIILFHNLNDARHIFTYIDSDLGVPLVEKDYATHCEFTFENLWEVGYDLYMLSHFLGWIIKSIMIRDVMISMFISVTWELVELSTLYHLPNFAECWWDQVIMDVMISNLFGIIVGRLVVGYLEAGEYEWHGFFSIPSATGKLKRLALQFTPESWMIVRWDTTKSLKRFFQVTALIAVAHIEELNHFYLKHLLWVPPKSILNPVRLVIMAFGGVAATRQWYMYISDPNNKKLGTQAWLCLVTYATEAMIIIKFFPNQFPVAIPFKVKMRVAIGILSYFVIGIGSIFWFRKNKSLKKEESKSE